MSSTLKLKELKDLLTTAGFDRLSFCTYELEIYMEIQHYELLKPGEQVGDGCSRFEVHNLAETSPDSIFAEYLDGKSIIIHPRDFVETIVDNLKNENNYEEN